MSVLVFSYVILSVAWICLHIPDVLSCKILKTIFGGRMIYFKHSSETFAHQPCPITFTPSHIDAVQKFLTEECMLALLVGLEEERVSLLLASGQL